jgi:hypothetical protein
VQSSLYSASHEASKGNAATHQPHASQMEKQAREEQGDGWVLSAAMAHLSVLI